MKLNPCHKCGLSSDVLLVSKHIDKVDGVWIARFHVPCGCEAGPLFDSEEEAANAWNAANPPKDSG
jgi:hypothetical protein